MKRSRDASFCALRFVPCVALHRAGRNEQVNQPGEDVANKPPLQNQADYVTGEAWRVRTAKHRTQQLWEKAEWCQCGGFGVVNNRGRGETTSQNY